MLLPKRAFPAFCVDCTSLKVLIGVLFGGYLLMECSALALQSRSDVRRVTDFNRPSPQGYGDQQCATSSAPLTTTSSAFSLLT